MASIKDLKKRIVSVKNTQQTTKAMKMVSAAKLRRAQEAIQAQRPYAREIQVLIRRLAELGQGDLDSPFFGRERAGGLKPRVLLVVVTSDRGLCAAFNSSVIKITQKWIKDNQDSYEKIKLSFIGKRGNDFLKTKYSELGTFFSDQGGKVSFAKAKKISDTLISEFLAGDFDEIKIVYNEFNNAMTQETRVEDFVPVKAAVGAAVKDAAEESAFDSEITLIRPDMSSLMSILLEKNFAIQTFRVMLESQAGEHGARMSAMENATKNASEMIRKLTLQYNKQRQAGITKELLEIIAGSESQKSA